jgi:hypothetical protein
VGTECLKVAVRFICELAKHVYRSDRRYCNSFLTGSVAIVRYYQWVVTKGTPNETGKIVIEGEGGRMKAEWSGTHGSGSVSGRVVTEASSLTIEWENGVHFFR